ncbi:hypothetical protein [Endozoicomonas sp. ONNA2]|uniref:hypothetical protein n=1 Tax=Endozoicomonas sp. ONNA2 TaxID=2828741 RepID=UPI0021491386|nr:hypothetical protein [Endozoicomonas sp. ONNA2]
MISGSLIKSSEDVITSSTKETPKVGKDDNSIEHKSYGQLLSHRAVSPLEESENLRLLMEPLPGQGAFQTMQSRFEARDITIDDPQFKQPPGKINKLALAIKIFCKSFWETSRVNTPETDRSPRVETIRSRVFTVTSTLLTTLSGVVATTVAIGLFLGALTIFAGMDPEGAMMFIPVGLAIAGLSFGVFAVGFIISVGISRLMTAIVSASVDTREKLTEITAFTSPEQRFLKKYQRMKKSLFELQTRFYAAELDRINFKISYCESPKKLELLTEKRIKLKADRIDAGIPDPYQAKWFDAQQHYCLRSWYWCNTEKLQAAISKIEAWLDRAEKQKALLTNAQRELEELNSSGKSSLKPYDLIHA